MPRKPLDSEHETVTCTVRMTISTRNALDQMRGPASRSEYLRELVEATIKSDQDWWESLPEATAPVPDARKSGGMITNSKMKIVPEKKHHHRLERGRQVGHQMRGSLKVPIYWYGCGDPDCEFGEERP